MKFRLGVFVLGAVVLLAVLIILFGESPALFSRQMQYTVRFSQAPGVEEGTPVRKSGVRIGEVTGFDLDPDTGEVAVRIVVDQKHQLRVGDRALLGSSFVLGTSTVNFEPVEGSDRTPAPSETVFQGEQTTDLTRALGKASDLLPLTQATLEQVHNVAKSLNEMMPQLKRTNEEIQIAARNFGKASERVEVLVQANEDKVAKALDNVNEVAARAANILNEDNEKAIQATLKSFRKAGESFETMSKNADQLVTDTRKTMKDVGERVDITLKNADGLVTDARGTLKTVGDRFDTLGQETQLLVKDGRGTIKRFNQSLEKGDEVLVNLQQITKPIAERTPMMLKNIEEGTARFNEMTNDVSVFTRSLSEGNGTLRKIVMDPTLYNNLDDVAVTLKKAISRLDRVIYNVEVFADKIARHPELLGVGGAVNPSSGLKDSPGAMPVVRPMRR